MSDIIGLFAMGRYGAYVWCTYGLVSVVLVAGVLHVRRLQIRTRRSLYHWFNRIM